MIAYPITVSPNGGLTVSTDPERDKILGLLSTRFWERCMIPGFGVPDYLFDPIDSNSIGEIVLAFQVALDYWIGDGIQVESVPVDPESGSVQILISYGSGSGSIIWNPDTEQLRSSVISTP